MSKSNQLPDRFQNLELPIKHTSVYDSVLRDRRLTPAAKALHCYMRTFDKEWKFHANWLAKRLNVSRPTMSKLLKELLDEGYLERWPTSGDKGVFMGYDYYVYPVRKKLYWQLLKEVSEQEE